MTNLKNLYQPDKIGQWGFIEGGDTEYFAYPAVSSSRLKLILKSWKHFKANLQKEPTGAMKLGTALHTCILEPKKFKENYQVFKKPLPNSNMNKAENKEAYQALINQGVKLVSESELEFLQGAGESIKENPTISKCLDTDIIERGIWYVHESGIVCKIKPDALRNGKTTVSITDIKKARDASPGGFRKACCSFDYPLQDSFYSMITLKVYEKPTNFFFIMCEDKPPYVVQHYSIELWQRGFIQEWINKTLWELSDMIQNELPFHGYSDMRSEKDNHGLITKELPEYYLNKYQY